MFSIRSASRQRRNGATRRTFVIEALEGRDLPSTLHGADRSPRAAGAAAADISPGAAGPVHAGAFFRGPVNQRINGATTIKHPMFYPMYNGPRVAALNAFEASGRFDHPARSFVFTGRLLGPVDPSMPALYVFLIDRGGSKSPGPYPSRSLIFFDAMVIVTPGPGGASGNVVLLDSSGNPTSNTPLPASAVSIQGNNVSAVVPTALIPSTSKDALRYHIGQYRYNFSPRVSLSDPSGFASFVPEYITAPVGKTLAS